MLTLVRIVGIVTIQQEFASINVPALANTSQVVSAQPVQEYIVKADVMVYPIPVIIYILVEYPPPLEVVRTCFDFAVVRNVAIL